MRVALLALLIAPTLAFACWNEVQLERSQEAKGVAQAEAQLNAGDATGAIKTLRALYGKRAVIHPDRITSSEPLGEKALGLIAIAIIRDGRLDPATLKPAKTATRARLMRHAAESLRIASLRQKDNPLARARYAEAASLDAKHVQDARHTLEELAKADLLAEPEAWRTLARLRAAKSDTAGRDAALARCTAMANAARCALPPAGGS